MSTQTQVAPTVDVNGEARTVPEASTLADLLTTLGLNAPDTRGVAVAVNDAVVPRREWPGVDLQDGDRVEIVTARQGG